MLKEIYENNKDTGKKLNDNKQDDWLSHLVNFISLKKSKHTSYY